MEWISHRQIEDGIRRMIRYLRENNVLVTKIPCILGSMYGRMIKYLRENNIWLTKIHCLLWRCSLDKETT